MPSISELAGYAFPEFLTLNPRLFSWMFGSTIGFPSNVNSMLGKTKIFPSWMRLQSSGLVFHREKIDIVLVDNLYLCFFSFVSLRLYFLSFFSQLFSFPPLNRPVTRFRFLKCNWKVLVRDQTKQNKTFPELKEAKRMLKTKCTNHQQKGITRSSRLTILYWRRYYYVFIDVKSSLREI